MHKVSKLAVTFSSCWSKLLSIWIYCAWLFMFFFCCFRIAFYEAVHICHLFLVSCEIGQLDLNKTDENGVRKGSLKLLYHWSFHAETLPVSSNKQAGSPYAHSAVRLKWNAHASFLFTEIVALWLIPDDSHFRAFCEAWHKCGWGSVAVLLWFSS